MKTIQLRTGVWYNDHPINLNFPDEWDVQVHTPDTPRALDEAGIRNVLAKPIGQPPLRRLAEGKKRPVIIVDDLARPTPAFKIMPFILEELQHAGIPDSDVRVLVATGTHGHQDPAALRNKLGSEVMDRCRVIIHDDRNRRELKYLGKTSQRSPVYIDREATDSDLLIGVGGVYPQHTTGFGGGSKLCLGILGKKTITHLHFKHKGVAGTYNIDNTFRHELDEIARMLGLSTMFTLHTNADLDLVHLMCGDHFQYYADAARFSRERYDAPYPNDADVVIANTYPSDISYTFMRKAMKVIRCAPPDATKIAIASNYEGLGLHGLFQQGLGERLRMYKALYHRISVMEPKVIFQKLLKHLFRINPKNHPAEHAGPSPEPPAEKMLIYRPPGPETDIPTLPGVNMLSRWEDIVSRIKEEHPGKDSITVRVYTCASLQCIDAEDKPQAASPPVSAMEHAQ